MNSRKACEVRMPKCTVRYMYHLVHKGRVAELHSEAEGVTRTTPEVARELTGAASSYCGWGPWTADGCPGPGDQAVGAARTHAGERCANAPVHTVSCAPESERPEGETDDCHVGGPGGPAGRGPGRCPAR